MNIEKIIKIHKENDAIPKFFMKEKIRGGILSIPKNILKSLPEREVIYDIDDNVISIYENKVKTRSIEVSIDYTLITLAIVDMILTCREQGYGFDLCELYDSNGNIIESESNVMTLFNKLNPDSKKKELQLMELINYYMETQDDCKDVPENISSGMELVLEYFSENVKND